MKPKFLILKFTDEDREFYYENKVLVIEDKKLIENLRRPNVKNGDSLLTIKSIDNIHISDVIQIRINLAETGHFLASFNKKEFDEKKRTKVLEEVGSLRNNKTPNKYNQTDKIKALLEILNKYHPIYVSFENNGEIEIDPTKLTKVTLKYPLLVLKVKRKKFFLGFKKSKKSRIKPEIKEEPKEVKQEAKKQEKPIEKKPKEKKKTNYAPIPLFDLDYFFVFVFALLGTFGITTAIFEIMNGENIAVFLAILGAAFTLVLVIAMQSSIYKRGKEKNPYLRYYLIIFIVIGVLSGIISGYYISKDVLKTENEAFNYKKMLILASIISSVAMISSVYTSILANIFAKRRIEKQKKKDTE